MLPEKFISLDVESIGLHGQAFAYGYVVIDRDGNVLEDRIVACPRETAAGDIVSRKWVDENVPHIEPVVETPEDVLNDFWEQWIRLKEEDAALVGDCIWPVETNFLSACVKLDPENRSFSGPYPMFDLPSVLMTLGQNPLGTFERLPEELPAHQPLNDARQSARILSIALKHAAKQKEQFGQLVLPV